MKFWITVKTLNERGKKKMHNAKLEWHLIGSHALSHMVSAFIYIYIYIDFNNVTVVYKCFYFVFLLILE